MVSIRDQTGTIAGFAPLRTCADVAQWRDTHVGVTVLQSRMVDGDHYRSGLGHFTTHAGSRCYP